jgi:MFS family permease
MTETNPVTQPPKRRSFFYSMLPLYIVAHCAHHLLTALPVPLLPYIRNEFSLSYTQASFVTSSFAIAGGIGQLPAGFLADRIGPRFLIMVGIVGVAIAGALVGLSQSYVMLLVLLMLMGLLSGGYHPAATPLISASVEPNQRGRALGLHLVGGNASFFLAPIIAGAIAGAWGWRMSFLGLAVPTVLFGLFFYFYLRRQQTGGATTAAGRGWADDTKPPPGNKQRIAAFLVMSVLGGGVGMSAVSFIALFAVDRLGASEQAAASLLSIVFFAGLWASPVGGYLSDRLGRVPIIVITSLASGVLVYLLPYTSLGISFYAVLFFTGIGNAFRMPVSEAFIMGQVSARRRSTIFGFYYFSMQYTGAVFAPLMGQLIDNKGFDFCFSLAGAIVVVVTLGSAIFLRGSRE